MNLESLAVLVIDNEPFQIKLLSRQLKCLGVGDVVGVTQGEEALGLVGADPSRFACVFCDLQMPGMDGVEVVRHLGELKYQGTVLLVSGEEQRTVASAVRLARAHRLTVGAPLQKPVDPAKLKAALEGMRPLNQAAPASVAGGKRHLPATSPADLQRGLAQSELVNHYQPKVDMSSGRVVGAECLVRWQHPVHGLVFPDVFIGMAEEHGLIDGVTAAVLDNALAQSRLWHDSGRAWQVAVNVSMDNLRHHRFVDDISAALSKHGVPPASLMLEVTESRLGTDVTLTMDILTRLKLRRIGLSIDDFGTGHSSLSQLEQLPFDELKIDRRFVHRLSANPAARAITKASLDMARNLGLQTVAEGIEDEIDWQAMLELGADKAQGWFIAKAMSPPVFTDWVREWEARRGVLAA